MKNEENLMAKNEDFEAFIAKQKKDKVYIFLANTYFQILTTLILIKRCGLEKSSVLYAKFVPPDVEVVCRKIKASDVNTLVIPVCRNRYTAYASAAKVDKSVLKYIKKKHPHHSIALVNFMWNIEHIYFNAKTIYQKCDSCICIEEGPSCYCNYTGSKIRVLLKKVLGDPYEFYKDKKVEAVFVSQPQKYPKKFNSLLCKLSLDSNWNGMDVEDQNKVLEYFIPKHLRASLKSIKQVGIVYTQPLSEDGYISEEEKIETYRRICNFYGQYGAVLLKPHPRDTGKYNFEGVQIIDKSWPSELMKFMGIKFDFVIGICTSAVSGTDGKEKINLNENYLKDRMLSMVELNLPKSR